MSLIYDYYWIIAVLQIAAIIHALKTGRSNYIWLLVFIPLAGAIIYFVVEVLPELQGKTGFLDNTLFNTKGSISELEKQLRISDTFANRTQLAAAYASRRQYDQAIAMYQSALTGHYTDDLEANLQIARVYFLKEDYEQSCLSYKKALDINKGKFIRTDDEFCYALSLYRVGQLAEAEEAFKRHIQFHKTFDAMYYYGELLLKQGRTAEANKQFETIIDQKDLIPPHVRKTQGQYVRMAKRALQ